MNKALRIPPKSKHDLTLPHIIADKLSVLIGRSLPLTRKPRTDGAHARKLVAETLDTSGLPPACPDSDYVIVPPRRKGVPKILREYVDTYLVTSGTTYNLQVWNRNPASESVQVEYASGDVLSAKDVRFVFLRINIERNEIRSVIVLTPEYIEKHFGEFGKPTIKHQLIIPLKARQTIVDSNPSILFYPDTAKVAAIASNLFNTPQKSMHNIPDSGEPFTLEVIKDRVAQPLLGSVIAQGATKTRGQALELMVAKLLGYSPTPEDLLSGGFPDIRNQLLEVKVQDSPTVDLGAFSPQFEEPISFSSEIVTVDVRYLIALMDTQTNTVEGIVLCPGKNLGEHFSYVADTSYKCQRSIPMNFFDRYDGQAVFNP